MIVLETWGGVICYSERKGWDYGFLNHEQMSFVNRDAMLPVNAFCFYGKDRNHKRGYEIREPESLVINSRDDFELALVLKKKENSRVLLTKAILDRIEEKNMEFRHPLPQKNLCMIGHSQLDNWEIRELCGYMVRNCGIRGISSFEYNNYILQKGLLDCRTDAFLMMHGTNDIVYGYTMEQILQSIRSNVSYIRKRNGKVPVYFLSCLHVNGRMDRSNRVITQLNHALRDVLGDDVIWISTEALDDEYGNLREEYTIDGLHLSKEGYEKMQEIVEGIIKRRHK